MTLYYLFTVDGDWDEYFNARAPREKRQPEEKKIRQLLKREMSAAVPAHNKLLHFIHTSETTRQFFLQPKFLAFWRKIQSRGGSVGVHYHHETYTPEGMSDPMKVMEPGIGYMTDILRRRNLKVISYRGGYLAFNASHIKLLERYAFRLDLSCEPDRHLVHDGKLAADWRGAPERPYRLSYEDHRKPGDSKVTEIPLGKAGGGSLYIDNTSLWGIWKGARALAKKCKRENKDRVVFILTHTYEFSSLWKWIKTIIALWICGRYGQFINDREAHQITSRELGEIPKDPWEI